MSKSVVSIKWTVWLVLMIAHFIKLEMGNAMNNAQPPIVGET